MTLSSLGRRDLGKPDLVCKCCYWVGCRSYTYGAELALQDADPGAAR